MILLEFFIRVARTTCPIYLLFICLAGRFKIDDEYFDFPVPASPVEG
jgi:hypothetical protein